jgi:serine/threonine-protein phosphatase PP1 catalytic subunit
MSVSGELLCSFELLKPLDSTALKNHIKKGRNKRNSMLNSPVSNPLPVASNAKGSPLHRATSRSLPVVPQMHLDVVHLLTNHSPPRYQLKAIRCNNDQLFEIDLNSCDICQPHCHGLDPDGRPEMNTTTTFSQQQCDNTYNS